MVLPVAGISNISLEPNNKDSSNVSGKPSSIAYTFIYTPSPGAVLALSTANFPSVNVNSPVTPKSSRTNTLAQSKPPPVQEKLYN